MGQYKNVGDCFLTLAEECNELSQAILKKYRFGGEWDSEVEGTGKTRRELVMEEMYDVLYQMSRCYPILGCRMNVEVESLDDDEPDPIDDSEHQFIADLEEWESRRRLEEEEMEREWMRIKEKGL